MNLPAACWAHVRIHKYSPGGRLLDAGHRGGLATAMSATRRDVGGDAAGGLQGIVLVTVGSTDSSRGSQRAALRRIGEAGGPDRPRVVDRAAVVPLYTPRLPDLTSPRVGNYQASPYGCPLFDQMWVR